MEDSGQINTSSGTENQDYNDRNSEILYARELEEFPYRTPITLIRFSALEVLISLLFIFSAVVIVFVYIYYGYEEIVRVSSGKQEGSDPSTGSVLFITYCYLTPVAVIVVVLALLSKSRVWANDGNLAFLDNSGLSLDDTVVEEIVPIKEKTKIPDPDAREQERIV